MTSMSDGSGAAAYVNVSQQTLLRVLEALGAQPLEWQAQADLVARTGATRDQTYRALRNLETSGWAESAGGGRWRLTPKVVGIAERTRLAIAEIHRRYLEDA